MISGMLVLLFCGIALAACLGVALAALKVLSQSVQKSSQDAERKLEVIESLTKLAAAKDVAAFQALEATASSNPIAYAVHEPMDDESVARRMMDLYSERGIDPSLALAHDSDPLEDFGGTDALFGKSH